MNFNNLNWITVLLLALNLTGIIQLSYWIVFMPTVIWAGLLLAVITMGLIVIVSNGLSMAEFNKLIEINKDNKKKDDE